jgi:hypothetical protein
MSGSFDAQNITFGICMGRVLEDLRETCSTECTLSFPLVSVNGTFNRPRRSK